MSFIVRSWHLQQLTAVVLQAALVNAGGRGIGAV